MNKGVVLSLLFCLPVLPAMAAERGFVENSEEIVNELTRPAEFGATRSFVVSEEPTRAITIRLKEQGREQDKKVLVQENSPEGVARLKVEFDVDSARLRPESYEILDQLGVALADVRVAGQQVCIKGHTDSDGEDQYNLDLSYERANTVRDYVIARQKLSEADLFVVGYGEQMPLAANDSAESKQLNRRVEITLGCPEVAGR
jgi:outer membrane protein OmpA-like peptidoglycan-associated protein